MILQKSKQCFKNQCCCKKVTNSKTLGQGRRLRLLLPVQYLTKCDVWSQYMRQRVRIKSEHQETEGAQKKKKEEAWVQPAVTDPAV